MGRPRKHENVAAKKAAFREGKDRFDVAVPVHIGATIRELSEKYGASKNEVIEDLIRYALTNRNWVQQGLLWSKHHAPPE